MAGSPCPPEIVKKVISTMGIKELVVSNVFLIKLIDKLKLAKWLLNIIYCPESSLTWFPRPESVPGSRWKLKTSCGVTLQDLHCWVHLIYFFVRGRHFHTRTSFQIHYCRVVCRPLLLASYRMGMRLFQPSTNSHAFANKLHIQTWISWSRCASVVMGQTPKLCSSLGVRLAAPMTLSLC